MGAGGGGGGRRGCVGVHAGFILDVFGIVYKWTGGGGGRLLRVGVGSFFLWMGGKAPRKEDTGGEKIILKKEQEMVDTDLRLTAFYDSLLLGRKIP